MHDTRLTIMVVNYKTREMTLECLRSARRHTDASRTQIIVVDNASADGSAEAIRREMPEVEVIALQENIGFGRANNLAAEHATGERLLLLNSDTVVLDGAIDELMRLADNAPDAGIWGGRTLFDDGTLNMMSCHKAPTVWTTACNSLGLSFVFKGSRLFDRECYGRWKRDTQREVDIVSGCFLMTTIHIWNKLGGFHPDFFMYGEETDFCIRAHKIGCRPVITPKATIIHYGGRSDRVRTEKVVKLFDARTRLIRKHWASPLKPFGILLMALWPLVRAVPLRTLAIFGFQRANVPASSWWSVWKRRHEWLDPRPMTQNTGSGE